MAAAWAMPSLETAQECEEALTASDRRFAELTAQLEELERYNKGRLPAESAQGRRRGDAGAAGRDYSSPVPRTTVPLPTTFVQRGGATSSSFGAESRSAPAWSGIETLLQGMTEELRQDSEAPQHRSKYESMLEEEKERTR